LEDKVKEYVAAGSEVELTNKPDFDERFSDAGSGISFKGARMRIDQRQTRDHSSGIIRRL
jgi:hypothetical protein